MTWMEWASKKRQRKLKAFVLLKSSVGTSHPSKLSIWKRSHFFDTWNCTSRTNPSFVAIHPSYSSSISHLILELVQFSAFAKEYVPFIDPWMSTISMSVESNLLFICSGNSLVDPWSAFPRVYNHKTEMVLGVHVFVCVSWCVRVCMCVCVCVAVRVHCGLLPFS